MIISRLYIIKNIIVFCSIIFFGCSTTNDGIPKSFKNHFPKKGQVTILFEGKSCYDKDIKHEGAWHIIIVQDEEGLLNRKLDTLIETSISKVSYNDSCVIKVPNRFEGDYNVNSTLIKHYELNNCIFISDFSGIIDFMEYDIDSFTRDFMFYIIENKPGQYLEKERLLLDSGIPEPWSNGLSRGIAINDQTEEIIFWVEIW